MNKLEVRGVSKSFDGKLILKDITICLQEGELVCLLGVSGSGKSTLFNIISGLMKPDRGKVFLDGEEISDRPGHISYMLQKDMLLPYRSIEDNVALPLFLRGIKKAEARRQVGAHFAEFGLEGTEKKWPSQLSGGMRQRAALLRTYMFSQNVALLDEPFSALDTLTKSAMHKWYLELMQSIRLTTLFISHDIDEAILLSDRVCILTGQPGRITDEIHIAEKRPVNRILTCPRNFSPIKSAYSNRLCRRNKIKKIKRNKSPFKHSREKRLAVLPLRTHKAAA